METYTLEETTEPIEGVNLATMSSGERMSIQYFTIEPGAEVPMHEHHHEQAGYIIEGELTFVLEDGAEVAVDEGESYVLDGDEPHAAVNQGDESVVGIDVFSPPRPNPDWAE